MNNYQNNEYIIFSAEGEVIGHPDKSFTITLMNPSEEDYLKYKDACKITHVAKPEDIEGYEWVMHYERKKNRAVEVWEKIELPKEEPEVEELEDTGEVVWDTNEFMSDPIANTEPEETQVDDEVENE